MRMKHRLRFWPLDILDKVDDLGSKKVKKTFRYALCSAEVHVLYLLKQTIGSMKPNIALNLSRINIP